MNYVQKCTMIGLQDKYFVDYVTLNLNELRGSYCDIYSSWIYRCNVYYFQLKFCKMTIDKNSRDRNILT